MHNGFFGPRKDFESYYSEPIKRARKKSAEDGVRRLGADRSAALMRETAKKMLRRSKADYLTELPGKVS